MISEIKAQYEKDGPMAILRRLKQLRRFDGEESAFWESYLASVAMLCRSPVAILMVSSESDIWQLSPFRFEDPGLKMELTAVSPFFPELFERAEKNGFAYERFQAELHGQGNPFILALSLESCGDNMRKGICLITDKSNSQQFSDIVVRAGLVADVPSDFYNYSRRNLSLLPVDTEAVEYEMSDLVGIAHGVMAQSGFGMACSTLVNEIAHKFSCSRVCIGWEKRGYVRLVSVSHLEDFKPDSQAADLLETLFEEVVDQETSIAIPPKQSYFVVDRAHSHYFISSCLSQVISLPILSNGKIKGVITCEKKDGELDIKQIETICLLMEIVAPWFTELHYRDKWIGGRALQRTRNIAEKLFDNEHLALKISFLVVSLLLALSLLIKIDYKVEGVATLQTDMVRFISAPFDGVVSEVSVREGEAVKAGDKLVSLDSKELKLKHSQESADIVRYVREADKSRAQNALADMKIAQSRVDELSSELARTEYNLGRATINSQSDGIVVEGDTKKLLGSPVAKGDVLMKVARMEKMYASVKIKERDIDEIRQGLTGELVLISHPEAIFTINVDKLIPLAEIDQHEGNIFVLKALFSDKPPDWWRPGMSGLARVDVGKKSIAWILTHRMVDNIRMYIWW